MRLIDKERLKNSFQEECGRLKCNRWDISAILDEIDNAPTIAPPPNDPLTRSELLEMDGEPVWTVFLSDTDGESPTMWALVSVDKEYDEIFLMNNIYGSSSYEEVWADIKAIYRCKPEGE